MYHACILFAWSQYKMQEANILCVWGGGGGVDLHGHKLMLTDRSQFMCTLVFCSLLPVVFILSCLSELNSHFHLKTKISPNVRSG